MCMYTLLINTVAIPMVAVDGDTGSIDSFLAKIKANPANKDQGAAIEQLSRILKGEKP